MDLGIPVYMIFSQKALIEMVNYLPTESLTLKHINGLGSKKIEQFGADIIQMIQHYCNQNNIEKMEIPLKNETEKKKKSKSDTKKVSFELFQAGKSINTIALERELTQNTIEGHLAHYVGLGELEVDLFLDKRKLHNIMSYFKTAENKSSGAAKAFFGDNITYSELRFGMKYLEFLASKTEE
ncbi:MAG: helix-turn-helix domain-containing protein, partial [Bacteroidales bacterium]|nr:helix-turn-helix domain-containing protein [Bacteroidales bacterium]